MKTIINNLKAPGLELKKGRGKKILFASIPADGHFNPLTVLARHLKAEGHDVRWYTAPSYLSRVKQLGLPAYPFRKAQEVTAHNINALYPDRSGMKSSMQRLSFDLSQYFVLRGPEFYADIRDIHARFPFDLMIADVAFTGIPYVKELLQVPVMAIGVMPLAASSRDLAPSGLGLTPDYSWFGRKKAALLRYLTHALFLKTPASRSARLLQEHGIDPGAAAGFDKMYHSASLVLQSGTPSFEYGRSDLQPNIRFAGPILPPRPKRYPALSFEEKILKYDKVILVTQGAFGADSTRLIIPALEAFKNTGHLVVVTTGGRNTEALRRQYPYDNCVIEDFIHFDQIMPFADVFVSNGGYGCVMMSISNKLPMVVAGIDEGRNEISARVGYFGLGINLKTERPIVSQLREAVHRVLHNPEYQRNVEVLSAEFTQYNALKECSRCVRELTAGVSVH
jgi:MGT family glycosyltransferase